MKKDPTTYLKIPRRTVAVQGPLGNLKLSIPPFVHLDHDAEGRRVTLSIEDREAKEQRQMWGRSTREKIGRDVERSTG